MTIVNRYISNSVKNTKKGVKASAVCTGIALLLLSLSSFSDSYVVDDPSQGSHAFIQFRVKHLGYSWLWGRFDKFSGEFQYDPKKPETNNISLVVDTTSLDTNHALRDKHLKSSDYLNFGKFTTAKFVSTKYTPQSDTTAIVTGDLTLAGVTKQIVVNVEYVGGGQDPWGGYRQGFEGRATINPQDFGLTNAKKLGPAGTHVELFISIEGIKKP